MNSVFRCFLMAGVVAASSAAAAQVASHAPVASHARTAKSGTATAPKPVARVNGAVLNDIDLKRMMFTIFPYGQQHNGIPKDMEPEIRRGAMEMIIFEELLYQEAKRRNLQVPAARLANAERAFRKQFPDTKAYEDYLKIEVAGSKAAMREKIRRSLLIEQMLKVEVDGKAAVAPAAVKAFYDANSKQFEHGESFSIQTISFLPPDNANAEQLKEAKAKAHAIVPHAKAAKTKEAFGVIAQQVSEDDWRMKMGDRGSMDVSKLPPEIVKAARGMKPGQVSDAIALGSAWVVFRLNAHIRPGKKPFSEVKAQLQSNLRKQRVNEVRAMLSQKLRKGAKIEVL